MSIEPDVIYKGRANALVSAKPEPPPNSQRRRRPLGLRPIVEPPEARGEPLDVDAGGDPVIALVSQSGELVIGLIEDVRKHFEVRIAKLEARLAEATAKVSELSFISERLRIEARGPAGERGPMGRDGAAGAPGPRGERGAKGEPGKAAPTITAWAVDADGFTAAPILSDGSNGATLRLRPLFESFNDQINADDDAAEADAARAQRAEIERDAEASRWAK